MRHMKGRDFNRPSRAACADGRKIDVRLASPLSMTAQITQGVFLPTSRHESPAGVPRAETDPSRTKS
jgi:hypothetical protein